MDERARDSALISALTTEHFVLQSARGALISEMVGRGNVYLSAVSSALIALGSWAQLGTGIALFVAAVLPALFIFGELTFVALVRSSLKNLEFMRRMQRIRGYYRTRAAAIRAGGMRRRTQVSVVAPDLRASWRPIREGRRGRATRHVLEVATQRGAAMVSRQISGPSDGTDVAARDAPADEASGRGRPRTTP